MGECMQIKLNKDIPVRYDVDVFVAGGGPAGIAAALAAATQKKKVLIIESQSCFGGMSTAGLIPAFMQFTDGVNFLAGGIGERIYTRYKEASQAYCDEPAICVSIYAESLKKVYDDLVLESGIDFIFQTQLIDVEVSESKVNHAICFAKSGMFAVKAKEFIDCTGDGDLATWAGADYKKGDENGNLMPATLCSLWADIDSVKSMSEENKPFNKYIERAYKDGVFSVLDYHLPGIWPVIDTVGGGNIGHLFDADNTDEISVTQSLVKGRKLVSEYERYFKEYLKGYENMKLITTASLLGIRETRRIVGDYVLSVEDFKNREIFDDEIGRYAYSPDVHPSKPDKKFYEKFEKQFLKDLRYDKGESYGIPYRILTPQKLDNVLVAGRCVSADRPMQGSIRVIPGCYITGQAAGIAAALAVEQDVSVHDVDVKELQRKLRSIGAYLPNLN